MFYMQAARLNLQRKQERLMLWNRLQNRIDLDLYGWRYRNLSLGASDPQCSVQYTHYLQKPIFSNVKTKYNKENVLTPYITTNTQKQAVFSIDGLPE